jgi:hypothetical protein
MPAPQTGSAVFTPSGRRVDVVYKVVDADSLVPSHTADLTPNPRFPRELQPRDRNRVASEVQVNRIGSELQPERLGSSISAMDGAPIVSADGVVESGNARVLGIMRAYDAGGSRAKAYRDFLDTQGFDTTGMRRPVLVRQRTTALPDAERVAFTREANMSSGLSLSASERAALDAEAMPSSLLDLLDGDVTAARNRPFVRGFLHTVARPGEEGAFVTAGGALSQEGTRRIRAALLHAAYEDSPLVASLVESGDDGLRAFGGALTDAAADVAKLRRDILAGDVDPVADIGRAAVEAANLVKTARQRNVRLADLVAQQDAFGRASNEATSLLRIAYGDDLSSRVSRAHLAEALRDYSVEARKQTTGARLFGEPMSAAQLLEGVRGRNGGSRGQAGSFAARAPVARSGDGETGVGAVGPGATTLEPEGAGAGGRSAAILGPEDSAEGQALDAEAVARLRAANAFNRDFKSTYDRGPVGSLLASAGQNQYRILSSSVPQRIFSAGERGGQTVEAYRRAVGDGDRARLTNFLRF